tara:strand:- start:4512 stop:6566 length:2055 start_codon:yes stop_codon:yes gene_type:complete
MFGLWLNRIRRGFNRSPQELRRRLAQEGRALLDRYRVSPTFGLDDGRLAAQLGAPTIEDLWLQLSDRPYPAVTDRVDPASLDAVIPHESQRLLAAAESALALEVDLLGSGLETLSRPILWDTDFKVEENWPVKFFRDIDVLNLESGSDVKVPWELSRLQWLIPVGQAYMLSGDEKYAGFAREVLTDWIEANPYGRGVNWAVAMEAAMRIFTWTWLFHVFSKSASWDGYNFRASFLRSLYEHGVFTERYIEDYGVNGNHCTADAGALVFAGLFFGSGKRPERWLNEGWQLLTREISQQVLADGTDFEGSIAYHRFVAELFFWPARYRRISGLDVNPDYQQRLLGMTDFTQSYTKLDGLAPLWGDADDGRVLPFGDQGLNDHTYLPDVIQAEWEFAGQNFASVEAQAELFWTFGTPNNSEAKNETESSELNSRAFKDGGFYIMATARDHVFIECGPVGFGGKGVHGHNDCLSFEACLDGVSLITDSGSFVYSASYDQRNQFRGTASHNTPMIDSEEQNRFVSDDELFALHNDAVPDVREWRSDEQMDVFVGAHSGYQRLANSVMPSRKIVLEKNNHRLIVGDTFDGAGDHQITIPFHFSPDCELSENEAGKWIIKTLENEFELIFRGDGDWRANIRTSWISPSYGVKLERPVLEFQRHGALSSLTVGIYPAEQAPDDPQAWLVSFK